MNFAVLNQKEAKIAFIASTLLILASLAWFFLHYSQLPPAVPLFYSCPWGKSQLIAPLALLLLPSLSLIVLVLNTFLANLLLSYPFLANLLLWGASLFAFLALFNLIKIINIVL